MVLGVGKLLVLTLYLLSNVISFGSCFDIETGAFYIGVLCAISNLALYRKIFASWCNASLVAFEFLRAVLLSWYLRTFMRLVAATKIPSYYNISGTLFLCR